MLHYYGLRKTARLIGNSVRRRKLTISAKLHRERRFTRRRRLSLLHLLCKCGAHLRVGAYNEIEKTPVFSSIPSLRIKVSFHSGKSLRKLRLSEEERASLFQSPFSSSTIVIFVPNPLPERASIAPPWDSAIHFAMDSPSPLPLVLSARAFVPL